MSGPRFSEETILAVARTTLSNGRSKVDALAEFGITSEVLDQFESDIQAAEALPNETRNRIELRDLTQSKDEALDACFQWGRKLRMRLQLAFGRSSPQANSFPADDFQSAVSSEATMMRLMDTLISLANQHQAELAGAGQTPEVLAQGTELLAALRDADAAQELRKDVKRSSTQERYQSFIGLYDTVNRINRVGRLVFENDPVNLALFESKWPTGRTSSTDAAPNNPDEEHQP